VHVLAGCAILLAILVAIAALTAAVIAYAKRDAARHPRGSGGLGVAMQELEGLFVESKKHVIEAERSEHEEEDDSGDPPEK
jgi:hypothetical protein